MRWGAQGKLSALGGGEQLDLARRGRKGRQDRVDRRVGPVRVMMGQGQAPGTRFLGHAQGIFDGAVPPAGLGGVFVRQVLGIVNDEIGRAQELDMAPVGISQGAGAGRGGAVERLVVERIDDARPSAVKR